VEPHDPDELVQNIAWMGNFSYRAESKSESVGG
jgi:hypothetical protein